MGPPSNSLNDPKRNLEMVFEIDDRFRAAYARACIAPFEAPETYRDNNLPFRRVFFPLLGSHIIALGGRDLVSQPNFWTAYMVAGWEASQSQAGDPSRQGVFVQGGLGEGPENTVILYVEGSRDMVQDLNEPPTVRLSNILIHEIGHTGDAHNHDIHGWIMDAGAPLDSSHFSPRTIHLFRQKADW